MGPMWNQQVSGQLPQGHWLHKAMAKEKQRLSKKKAAPQAGTDAKNAMPGGMAKAAPASAPEGQPLDERTMG